MSKKVPLYTVLLLTVLAILVTFQITYLSVNNKYTRKLNDIVSGYNTYEKLMSVDDLVRQYYLGEIDEDELSDSIMRGYINGIGDKYASYLSSDEYAEFMKDQNAQSSGIGIRVVYDSAREGLYVVSVAPSSPALEAGIVAGDCIVSIEGESVAEKGYYSSVAMMKGDEGTEVSFTVRRNGSDIDFKCVRTEVEEVTVMGRMYKDANGNSADIGIIRIMEFDSKTPEQFASAVDDLASQGATKFVFDVRSNPGGELNAITTVLDYLLPEGPIVRTYDKNGKEEIISSSSSSKNMPIAVLINGNTASAAELFAAALRDYTTEGKYDATLVGTTTYGKGTMQTLIRLGDNSAISISNKRYNPPYSDNYEGVGVKPDIECDLDENVKNTNLFLIDDKDDAQLMRAVELLSAK